MGKAKIVSGGTAGSYTIEVSYDTTRIDARLADIAATLPIIQAELNALDTQLTTSRADLTAAAGVMNAAIAAMNAAKPVDGATIDGLIDALQGASDAIAAKNIEIDDAYQTLAGYEAAIDAATQDETAKRAAYQQAQAALSAYVAETGDTSSGYYLSQVAGVEIKLAAYQDAQQITIDTKATFEPQIATQKAAIEQLKEELKALQADYKSINASFVAVAQVMEQWSSSSTYSIDVEKAGIDAIKANAKYVLTKFKRDEKKREVAELTQEQKWLNKVKGLAAETRQAWCADYTENLAANTEVGTIEIAQEWQGVPPIIIRPGYSGRATYSGTRDGLLNKLQNMSPHSAWFNMALYPAVAKWKPQYRRGTLTAKSGNYGTVVLEDTYSSATQVTGGVATIAINQQLTTLTDVPIEYMTCNGGAFAVGDRVVVEFQNRDWSQPKVIGFVDNPKKCPITWPNVFVVNISITSSVVATGALAWNVNDLNICDPVLADFEIDMTVSWSTTTPATGFSLPGSHIDVSHTLSNARYKSGGYYYTHATPYLFGDAGDNTNYIRAARSKSTANDASTPTCTNAISIPFTSTVGDGLYNSSVGQSIVTLTYVATGETKSYYMLFNRPSTNNATCLKVA